MHDLSLSAAMTFAEAFGAWIDSRVIEHGGAYTNARYMSDRSERDLRQYARAAEKFFGALPLKDIHAGHFKTYQRARALCDRSCANWEKRAGANLIRKEVQTVIRVMKAAGAWTETLEKDFEPLQQAEPGVPRAMSPEEQHDWLLTASSKAEWRVVYWWSIVALQTTMSTNEMRALRLGDIFLEQGRVQVSSEGAKNKFRLRTIPLQTPECVWALSELAERARTHGARGPQSYLFPFHLGMDQYDALKPMSVWGLRKAWGAVKMTAVDDWERKYRTRETALARLTPYDLRHAAITRMAESGVPIQVIMSFAGHISARMQQHYTTISMEAKRRWAAATWASTVMPYGPGDQMRALPHGVQPQESASGGRWVWQPSPGTMLKAG